MRQPQHNQQPIIERPDRLSNAGRRTLLEAAAGFKALAERSPDFHWGMFRELPGGLDDERYCRMALSWVSGRLPQESSQAEAVLFRLEADLQAHLREHGNVVLPPP